MKSKSLHHSPLSDLYPDDPPLMEFGGWEMPRDFGGIVREHRAVREDCGVFDLSHMGRLVLRGETALEEAGRLFTRSCKDAENGRALYGFFCDEEGGCIDDAILYRRSEDEVWMVVNAANRERVVDWIENHRESATLEDRTLDSVLLAVQGPQAPSVLEEVVEPNAPDTPFRTNWRDSSMVASTGYTGEAGGEVWLDEEDGRRVFEELVNRDVTPCGLGARDTLRLEKGFPLHGHELSDSIDPVTGQLEAFIEWDHEFVGRDALETIRENGPEEKITGVMTDGRQSPREGYPLRTTDGNEAGAVTSGGFSPVLGRGIGMALVRADVPDGGSLEMKIRGDWQTVEHVSPPFV